MKLLYLQFTLVNLPLIIFGFNINDTAGDYLIYKSAFLLLGTPSSKFTSESFINFVLYGHDDILFSLSDIFDNYGSRIKDPYCGSVIIGIDLKLAWIGLTYDTQTFAIPIPGSVVTEVPINYLQKFFPKGYIILKSSEISYMLGIGYENGTFDTGEICYNCLSYFTFSNYTDDFLSVNAFWEKYSNSFPYMMYQIGYVEDFSSTEKRGLIKIFMYHIVYNSKSYFKLVDNSPFNEYNIHILSNGSIAYDGSLFINFLNISLVYSFYGVWTKW